MQINFTTKRGKDYLQIDDATIVYRNFKGAGSKFNREGDRNFSLVIPNEDIKDELIARGWNVKVKLDEEGAVAFMHLPVKVKFSDIGPKAYLKSGKATPVILDEETIDCLDDIDIASVGLDIRAYDWEMPNGNTGRTAYLDIIEVVQNIDRFAARYESAIGFGDEE